MRTRKDKLVTYFLLFLLLFFSSFGLFELVLASPTAVDARATFQPTGANIYVICKAFGLGLSTSNGTLFIAANISELSCADFDVVTHVTNLPEGLSANYTLYGPEEYPNKWSEPAPTSSQSTKVIRSFQLDMSDNPVGAFPVYFNLSQANIGSISPENISLFIYDSSWQNLSTTVVSGTTDPAEFYGVSPHFSKFFIGKKPPATTTTTTPPSGGGGGGGGGPGATSVGVVSTPKEPEEPTVETPVELPAEVPVHSTQPIIFFIVMIFRYLLLRIWLLLLIALLIWLFLFFLWKRREEDELKRLLRELRRNRNKSKKLKRVLTYNTQKIHRLTKSTIKGVKSTAGNLKNINESVNQLKSKLKKTASGQDTLGSGLEFILQREKELKRKKKLLVKQKHKLEKKKKDLFKQFTKRDLDIPDEVKRQIEPKIEAVKLSISQVNKFIFDIRSKRISVSGRKKVIGTWLTKIKSAFTMRESAKSLISENKSIDSKLRALRQKEKDLLRRIERLTGKKFKPSTKTALRKAEIVTKEAVEDKKQVVEKSGKLLREVPSE